MLSPWTGLSDKRRDLPTDTSRTARVENDERLADAVVKLRDVAGHTVLSFYVSAGAEVSINSVPEGTFTIEFATGRGFSPACGYFLSDMASSRFVDPETFETQFPGDYRYTSVLEITLNPVVGGAARTVSTDDTVFDRD